MVQCTKKNSRECLWVVECWNSIQVPKRHSRDFFFLCDRVYPRVNSVKLACTYADSLSNSRVYLQVIGQKCVYWLVYSCSWLCLYTHIYMHVFGYDHTRASIRAWHFFPQVISRGQVWGYEPDPLQWDRHMHTHMGKGIGICICIWGDAGMWGVQNRLDKMGCSK